MRRAEEGGCHGSARADELRRGGEGARNRTGRAVLIHPFPPLYDGRSRVLILGSFPSVRSREEGFYYAHPQNRFWRVLAAVFGEETPEGTEEKRAFLLRNGVALWDVIRSCEITGSSDASIRNAVPNDLTRILRAAPIGEIYVNGKTAERVYRRYSEPRIGRSAVCLPSTSPANAAWSVERLVEAWHPVAAEAVRGAPRENCGREK